MQTIHLTEYHLGGAPQGGAASEGTTPAPQLPDAGKPYVESVSYDKDAKKLRLRAQNARAGEVKTPLGDWQEFPIEVPTPPAPTLPDAGKPFVEGVTYDPDTKKVKVRAKVAQAGEVKDPIGEVQEFPIHVPAPPTPTLPDAGRPYVESCTFDSATKQVKVRARTPQAGEVKTPLGDWQEFPIQVPPSVDGAFYYLSIVNLSGQTVTIKLFHTNQEVTLKQKENKIITCDITSKEPLSAFLNLPIYKSGVRVSNIWTGVRDGRLCIGVSIVIYMVNGVPDSSDPTE